MSRVELLRCTLSIVIGPLCWGQGPANADVPAWRKEKYYARVKAGEPIATVSTTRREGARRRLSIAGGGRVRAPRDFTYDFSKKLDRVALTSGYVERATINAAGDRLRVTFKALGLRADFDVGVKTDDAAHRLEFEILGGPLRGLVATVTFTEIAARETEVALDGHYDYETFPLKGTLLTVGMEGVFKAMATQLQRAVTAEFKGVDNPSPGVEHSAESPGET